MKFSNCRLVLKIRFGSVIQQLLVFLCSSNKKSDICYLLLVSIPRSSNFVTSLCTLCDTRSSTITAHTHTHTHNTANRQLRQAPDSLAKPGENIINKVHELSFERMQTRRINLRLITLHFLSARRTGNHQLFINPALPQVRVNEENWNFKSTVALLTSCGKFVITMGI